MKTASSSRAMLLALIIPTSSLWGALAMATAVEWKWAAAAKSNVPEPPHAQNSGSAAADRALNGRALFVQNCAHCHGEDAGGNGEDGDGPSLHELRISDARIKTVIRHGIKGEMPSFAKKLSDPAAMALINYLRTLPPSR